jgi:hypothetical protein
MLKENNCKPRLLYPANLSFIIEEEIKTFHDKQKLNQFMSTKPVLHKILKGIQHAADEHKHSHEIMGRQYHPVSTETNDE